MKTMEKQTGHWQAAGDTMEDVQSQKDVVRAIEKDLGVIEWELRAILEYGETLCKDKAIFEKEKEDIRAEMDLMETAFKNSQKNVEDRKLRLVYLRFYSTNVRSCSFMIVLLVGI